MSRAPAVLFTLIVGLAAAAGAALAAGARPPAGAEERAREFQQLVGGLGGGPALDLDRCASGFDPRLCPARLGDGGPVPGAALFFPVGAPPPPPGGDQGPPDAVLP